MNFILIVSDDFVSPDRPLIYKVASQGSLCKSRQTTAIQGDVTGGLYISPDTLLLYNVTSQGASI
jgi:hypothetical protein